MKSIYLWSDRILCGLFPEKPLSTFDLVEYIGTRNLCFVLSRINRRLKKRKNPEHVLVVYLKNNLLRFGLWNNRVTMEADAWNDYLSERIVRYYFLITAIGGTRGRWNTIKYSTQKSERSAKEVQIVHSFLVITTVVNPMGNITKYFFLLYANNDGL